MNDAIEDYQPSKVDLEMFEVGLGSAIYLRLRGADGDIRILADGGVGNGYVEDHVLTKLNAVFEREEVAEPRIDLMIATHYDEDHLKGLVPIVRSGIAIGDVWLPPVTSEDRNVPAGTQPARKDMLGEVLTSVPDLLVYLRERGREITRAHRLLARLGSDSSNFYANDLEGRHFEEGSGGLSDEQLDALIIPFRIAYNEAGGPAAGCDHADDADLIDPVSYQDLLKNFEPWGVMRHWRYLGLIGEDALDHLAEYLKAGGDTKPAILSLRYLVKISARKAINGAALHRLTVALAKAKVVPKYLTISRGIPEDFRWDAALRRFEPASGPGVAETQIALLGPSDWLVGKFRDRLPARAAVYMALTSNIPVKGITPSNDLSYVLTISHAGQTTLICGDTGMWDFKAGRNGFEKKLLERLTDVSVAQVAHHAGLNRYFYHSLREAWRGRKDAMPYLLVSHAENDAHRPNTEFETFVRTGWDRDATNLLFTCQPSPAHVTHIRHRLHKLENVPAPMCRCDIRMSYSPAGWAVLKHGIKV
ncbi:hypothetical protein Q4511_16060 [Paracoccus sp. 1_MG-2023]|uniref:hypothetical protein n=1 Tax=unclassified Paracoccus (in: a-proteobacteria) TaxID=2688777 RepID=UPI001C08A513|nr:MULTISPECIES: hypothetical protein [unclassified Paracoccus (in: a-proteobacteria)]MBU2956115.1 hypothetical protein [Paracoccus sp. C2R09]MDO6670431.1 hypothetical protein [Paracoccus sp. 1_MG-2023]